METLILMLLALSGVLNGAPQASTVPPKVAVPQAEGEAPAGAGGASAAGGSGRALVVGDSLAEGTEAPIARLLPGWRIETSAYTGRHTSDGVSEITGAGRLPPVLVVSLGTNDDPSATSSFASEVEAVLAAAGASTCVVWPNIVRPPYNGVSYSGYNRILAREAATNPNLIVVDWVGIASRNPGTIASDGVHATPDGYDARAQAIASAMRGCGSGGSYGAAGGAYGGAGVVGD